MRFFLGPTLLFPIMIFAQGELLPEQASLSQPTPDMPLIADRDLDELCLLQNAGRFWSIDNGLIREWIVSNGIVTGGAQVLQGPADMSSLAFCSASGPTTFYTDLPGSGIQFYDNETWEPVSLGLEITSAGGSGQHLYFIGPDNAIYHFDGTNATLIVDAGADHFKTDIVVDTEGNAVVAYGNFGENEPAAGFKRFSPNGELLNTYAHTFLANSSWGAFMLEDTVYIAFGPAHPDHGNMMVPFSFAGNFAGAGTAIFFPQSNMTDLASCTEPGSIGIIEQMDLLSLAVLLDPASGNVLIEQMQGLPLGNVAIHDLSGRLVFDQLVRSSSATINASAWPDGVYLVRSGNGMRRLVKTDQ